MVDEFHLFWYFFRWKLYSPGWHFNSVLFTSLSLSRSLFRWIKTSDRLQSSSSNALSNFPQSFKTTHWLFLCTKRRRNKIENVDQITLLRFKKIWSTLLSIYHSLTHTHVHDLYQIMVLIKPMLRPIQTITNENEIINTKIASYDLQSFLAPKLCFSVVFFPLISRYNSLALMHWSMLSLLVLFYFDLINTQFCFDNFVRFYFSASIFSHFLLGS